jgi:hypothetical protein
MPTLKLPVTLPLNIVAAPPTPNHNPQPPTNRRYQYFVKMDMDTYFNWRRFHDLLMSVDLTRKYLYGGYGARFPAEIYARGCHWFLRRLARSEQACDQWHSSRVFTFLTGWRCKFRPNTVKVGRGRPST